MIKFIISITGLFFSANCLASAIGDSLSQVNIECAGSIYSLRVDSSKEKLVSDNKKLISVINPWYGKYGEQKTLKEPQDIVIFDTLAATVKKGINSKKEIVLEVYTINPESQRRDRVGFAAGEATSNGTGVSLNVRVGNYETLFWCKEAK